MSDVDNRAPRDPLAPKCDIRDGLARDYCAECGVVEGEGAEFCGSAEDRQARLFGGRDPESLSPYGAGNGPAPQVVSIDISNGEEWVALHEVIAAADPPPMFAASRHAFSAAVDVAVPIQEITLADDAPRVIGLCGAAGAGKSTVAAVLAEYGYTRLRFADPLKSMLRTLLAAAGVAEDEVERMVEGDLKELPHPALGGKSPRLAMQTLGTEWGRTHLGLDFWVNTARRQIRAILGRGGRVVVEDCRFPNEAEAIRASWPSDPADPLGGPFEFGQLWLVTGRGGIGQGHESEAHLSHLAPDLFLDNSGCLERLEAAVLAEVLG
ncbi:hypothetical protein [Phaeobacter gallaeciensis]|uniref:hypothetical protein n=1 Tax=Phaeobacter gallaeciensis TaxID=60890 RepID=UPI00237F64F5|nr:hypothetical protein [Phaeobacter gallaeciensis]MDE4059787.1 hypothetical protein [Phaeobacter gallaeciensis]MDE4122576.1 hypothetical protein [Phaeobacter gallaeciensis]MDE4127275.1 hypothetical protein [Phaeobacter gallaeciensis]